MKIIKEQWGPGPWQDEPDSLIWEDPETGLLCLAKRGPVGSWCGYVGVPKDHPAYEIDYDGCTAADAKAWREQYRRLIRENAPEKVMGKLTRKPEAIPGIGEVISAIEVHGGLTFADKWPDINPDLWFLGFDCAHAGDLSPRVKTIDHPTYPEIYRTLEYVQGQCRALAKQLAALATLPPHKSLPVSP